MRRPLTDQRYPPEKQFPRNNAPIDAISKDASALKTMAWIGHIYVRLLRVEESLKLPTTQADGQSENATGVVTDVWEVEV